MKKILKDNAFVTKNKKAFFDYEISETWEAGIELFGYEVKSIRNGSVNLKGAFVSIQQWQAFLKWMHVSVLKCLPAKSIDPDRIRKLFLHRKTIDFLASKSKEKGTAIIPLEVYFKWNLIKIKIGLAKGRKKYEKKQVLKERAIDKQAKQAMKKYI